MKLSILCSVIVSLLATLSPVAQTRAARQPTRQVKPNIVCIIADDLGYGDLASFGARDLRTPHLDALAAGGVRLTNFYANAPVCSPTRAALLTGRYPDLVGVPGVIRTHADNNWGALSPQAVLLPALLKRAGYNTAIVGKWHLGLAGADTPNARGFDLFHGFLGDMMDDYYNHRRHGINYMRRDAVTIDPRGHATDLFTTWATDYLNSRRGKAQPFFLYLAYNAPHDPVQPPAEWVEKVKRREPGIGARRAKLVALIEHMDDGVGRVLAALRANGQDENTLVVFTSDNGGQLNLGANCGDVRGGKQDLYEGGIRVPLIAAWPGRVPRGSVSNRVALTMDLFPTFCEAAGAPVAHKIEGVSVLPALRGENQPALERDLFWMRREGGLMYNGQDYYAVRRGNWKLVHNRPFEPLQLYNLAADPREERDVSKEQPQIYEALSAALRAQIQRAGAVPWQRPQRMTNLTTGPLQSSGRVPTWEPFYQQKGQEGQKGAKRGLTSFCPFLSFLPFLH
jgi:arylsulfatase A-like enzyme